VRPPTLHCEEPSPALAATRFRTLSRAEPWDEGVRRAGVNAFGFGGINAHVIVESHGEARGARRGGVRATLDRASRASRAQFAGDDAQRSSRGGAPKAIPAREEARAFVCAAATQQALAAALDGH